MSFEKAYAKARAKMEREHPIVSIAIYDHRQCPPRLLATFAPDETTRARKEHCEILERENCGVEEIRIEFNRK